LFIVDHDGGNPRKIAIAPGEIGDIKFSPDSSRLRFTVYDLGKRTSSIWEVRSVADYVSVAGLELRRNADSW